MKLKDQVAIVTGAGRNIGEEVAKLFATEGAKIAVVDMDRPRGQRTVDAIKAAGGDAELYATDVSKGADVAAMVKAVVGRFGHVDILVNNVAISDNKTILECTEEDWDRVMTVTLKSQFLMSKHVAQQMVAQGGGGKIVNVGSTSGWQGRPRAIAYSAAKAAIANFTRALAVQLAPHNIRVNAIVPNKIGSPVGKDEFDPTRPVENMLKRAGQPDRGREGDPVPRLRRFVVRDRREPVRRRRHDGDGSDRKLSARSEWLRERGRWLQLERLRPLDAPRQRLPPLPEGSARVRQHTSGPLPVQFGGLVALMRRASLTSSLIAPVIGSDRPALSVISATTCMSLSAQVKEIMSHSLSASEAPELIISASRSLTRSMPVVSASRPASISPTAVIQSSRLFMVLPTWPWPTSPRCA